MPKHFGLGDLEQTHVRTVENDSGEVYVGPTAVFLNDERLRRGAGAGHPPEKPGASGLALAFGERERTGRGEDRGFAEILCAVFQWRNPGTETLQSIAHIAVLAVDNASGRRIGVQHTALLIEDDHALVDGIDDGTRERGKRGGRVTRRAYRLVDHWLVILIQN